MEIIYEQWADDMNEARYFEPPYDDSPDSAPAPTVRLTPRPEGTPLLADCIGCVDECHCTEIGRLAGDPPCAFCTDLEQRTRPTGTV